MTRSVAIAAIIFALPAQAQEQDLSSAASDPTASLTSFIVQDFFSYDYHNLDGGEGNRLQFRMAIPFEAFGYNNIFRITLPYVTDSPGGASGFSDVTIFNLVTFDRAWGRFGVGAVALLPTGEDGLSAEKWGLGPAVGFVAQKPWGVLGLFNQNVFTVAGDDDRADVDISILQPILSYGLGDGWSVGTSDMSITYDWNESEFVSLPLGLQINKLTKVGGVAAQLSLSYEHNFYDEGTVQSDTLGLTVKFLVP